MTRQVNIDFVSDIACPWCAVGLSSLLLALSHLGDTVDARIAIHPFELNPQMTPEGEDIIDYITRKYGRTAEQIAETRAVLRERGASVGFTFGARSRTYNTFDAHRLLYWAGTKDKQLPLKLALLQAYHSDDKDPSNHDVLVQAAESVGLDAAQARDILENGDYADEVRAEENEYMNLGIQSVPAVIINRRYLVSGGQPPDVFERAIQQTLAEA